MVQSQAYMMSTIDYFTMLGWLFLALLVIIWLAARRSAPSPARPPPGTEDERHSGRKISGLLLAAAGYNVALFAGIAQLVEQLTCNQ